MASASALRPTSQGHHAPTPQLRACGERGRSKSRDHCSPSRSIALAPAEMGANSSKPVAPVPRTVVTVGPPVPEKPQNYPTSNGPSHQSNSSISKPLATAYGKAAAHGKSEAIPSRAMGSICRSPTWSPRGSLAARTQAEKGRRDKERALRKEAEEAKKRLKESKDQQGRRSSEPSVPASASTQGQPKKLQKKRWSKQPPPAAMETQRMPTALRSSQDLSPSDPSTPDEESQQKRRSRSSSFSSMLRMVTRRSGSTSGSRRGSMTEDEAYISDASSKSKSSFIGGVKLRRQQQPVIEFPTIGQRSANDSGSFVQDMRTQINKIAGKDEPESASLGVSASSVRDSTGPSNHDQLKLQPDGDISGETAEVNANMGRRRSQKLDSETRPDVHGPPAKVEEGKKRHSITEHLKASREASLNRMQNLVTPLRSAMKGSREIAKGGRTQSMPLMPATAPASPPTQAAAAPSNANYVQRSRMHTQTRSLAGWHDEMAVREANELAAAQAAAEAQAASASNTQASYGGHMPPSPDDSVNDSMTPRASHDTAGNSPLRPAGGPPASSMPRRPEQTFPPGMSESITWKQPIKANKTAAEQRAGGSNEQGRVSSDIDKLPSQNSNFRTPEIPTLRAAGIEVSGNASKLPSPTSPISPSSDEDYHGLRRHPAVMSWKADKEHSKYPSLPRSSTMPMILSEPASPESTSASTTPKQNNTRSLRPEDHPSLAALRSHVQPTAETAAPLDYSDPIDRPFSIIPTPVASPAPGTKGSSKPTTTTTRGVKSSRSLKTKKAASQAIDKLKEQQAEAEAEKSEESHHQHQTSKSDEEQDRTPTLNMPAPLKPTYRRYSTPPTEVHSALKSAFASSSGHDPTSYPFPERHEPLVRVIPAEKVQSSAASNTGSYNKVTFHTPPESPRFLSVLTSYDSYRRGNGNGVDANGHSSSDLDDDLSLPVPVHKLGASKQKTSPKVGAEDASDIPPLPKPNPPFAQGGMSRKPNSPRSGRSPDSRTRVRSADGKGYVYVNFSPTGSTSTLATVGSDNGRDAVKHGKRMPKGFVIKNADGAAMDPVAKLFVICCGCRKWHDVPSDIYRGMAKGVREREKEREAAGKLEEEKVDWEKMGEKERERTRNVMAKREKERQARTAMATVACCWCGHEMSVMCCEGWSTLCYQSAQYHAMGREREVGNGVEKGVEKRVEKGVEKGVERRYEGKRVERKEVERKEVERVERKGVERKSIERKRVMSSAS